MSKNYTEKNKSNKIKPFISVVIPAFNEEEYLPNCLEALQKQTYPKDRFEIIVVDNNSSDRTAEIAKSMGARVVNEKQQGHVFAVNKGMLSANGEIIANTDSDSEVGEKWLEIIEKVFQDEEIAALTGPVTYTLKSKVKRKLMRASYHIYLKIHFALGKPSLAGVNLALRKDVFHKIKGMDTRYHIFGDVELGLRIKKVGKVVYCKDIPVLASPRRWEKGSLEDYYKYLNSYFKTVWLLQPPRGDLTPRR